MGFSVNYRSTRPVSRARAKAIEKAASELCDGRTWLSSEGVSIWQEADGHLCGDSKPTFLPNPSDVAQAARTGLPDGTARDILEILCRLSRDHRIDWEISHDYSDGPVGYIRRGVCDEIVHGQFDAIADLQKDLAGDAKPSAGESDEDEDDDGPTILSFTPKGR